jgi:transglutaminase/protease-like cytokinesis protein 3|nr:MAG TPA: tail tube protein [Bacteriophage sp.]
MKCKGKNIMVVLICILSVAICTTTFAHSGRTDSSGGHRDNKNKSGLGNYHYHCGGHPAHLHTGGVCPYSSSSKSSKRSTSSSSSSTKKTSTVPTTIVVTDIKINENVTSMKEGEIQKLTVTITPNDATDKNITWKSSDENIATVSITGEVVAKKYGTVDIRATSSNGKTSTIKINIKESQKVENSAIIKTSTTSNNNIANNTTTNNRRDSNPLGEFLALGLIGGGGYIGYKKHKNKEVY